MVSLDRIGLERLPLADAMMSLSLRCMTLVSACWTLPVLGADIQLTDTTRLHFGDVRDGVAALSQPDEFLARLSPFDYQVRLKTDRPVGQQDLLAHVAPHVRPWTEEEIARLTPAWEAVAEKIAPWNLPLPRSILLVKTDGLEDAGAAYTRGTAIVLPQRMVDGTRQSLDKLLPHELFHVLSRHNPQLRQALYRSIGFQKTNEVPLPGVLQARRITNPDAPINDQFITVQQNGRTLELMPVLFSKTERYDPARGGNLFAYLNFKLMALVHDGKVHRPLLSGDQPVLYEPSQVGGFFDQVGRNTDYIIHPEEILADNFVMLISGRQNLPSPFVVQRMAKVLKERATEPDLQPAGVN